MRTANEDALGIYVSVPFCASKCSFCNFASDVFAPQRMAGYVERVCAQMRSSRQAASAAGARLPAAVDTVYFGGGTPSMLPPELFLQIACAIAEEFEVLPQAEWTVECAPGQLSDATLRAMAPAGVNRISFGVQSFVEQETRAVGRLHSPAQTLRDIARVRDAGVARISVDLIAGLPHQTMVSWRRSLDVLLQAGVDHASVYMLEVDDDSRLGREVLGGGARLHAPAVPQDDVIAEMYEVACEVLESAGLRQYEISNFAKPGAESQHNLRYWLRRPYLGLGLDAHSMLRTENGRAVRAANADELDAYMRGDAGEPARTLHAAEELEEALFLGLRMAEGVSVAELRREFGALLVANHLPRLAELRDGGLLRERGGRFQLTGRGRMISNDVFAQFLEPAMEAALA